MKLIKFLIAILMILTLFLSGYLAGHLSAFTRFMDRAAECEEEVRIVSSQEVCAYYKLDITKAQCANTKHRYTYAYTSHKIYACLYGKRGVAWGLNSYKN